MKVLLTGGNGYVAKSLYSSLRCKYDIISVSRNDFDLIDFKALDNFLQNKYFDVVIHTAIKGGNRLVKDESYYTEVNLKMYYNLLQQKDNHFKKLISFGSGIEDYEVETPYSLSKKIISKSISEVHNFYNLRIYGVFDEFELDRRFIKSNLKRYINKEPMEIYGDRYMDFFYMKDLIKLVEFYIDNDNLPKQTDCVYKDDFSLANILEFINTINNYKVEIKNKCTPNENYISLNKSNNLYLDYIGLKQGILNTYSALK